jgi:hypothetical protein
VVVVDAGSLAAENILEVGYESGSKLFRGSGLGSIRVMEVNDSVFPISFGYGLMEERGVAIT